MPADAMAIKETRNSDSHAADHLIESISMTGFPTRRLRRLRLNPSLREMLAEVRLARQELIAPLFVRQGLERPVEIPSLPGHFQHSVESAMELVKRWADLGLQAVLLFGIPEKKDSFGSAAWDDKQVVQQLAGLIKAHMPGMVVMTDVCLCEYTDHGHCGPMQTRTDGQVTVDNDAALESLARIALSHARCGSDVVSPSAMMDGQVGAIRHALDAKGFKDTAIMSYSVKFASSMYGPFRQAAQSAPSAGDRKSYQMDYRCPSQSFMEAQMDIDEGADIIMVKPAATYLDVIRDLRGRFEVPLCAYHVSGEYAAIKAAAMAGWIDERAAVLEVTTAIKRAGANLIITYYAEQLAQWI